MFSKISKKFSTKSSTKSSECNEKQNEVFCEKIREFVSDSRKCQTIYAHFEGYHVRSVNCNDLNNLDNIIFLTLSDGKSRASLTPEEFDKTNKLTQLMVKKINNSRMKFNWTDIRFQVVWMYYFDYLEKEMKAMPVFKVYKRSCGEEAFYIDISVVEYESWDHFIMFSQFPISFMCIPRRGEYTFQNIDGSEMLDLEYICKNSKLRNGFNGNLRPFSQTVIQDVLPNVMRFVRVTESFIDMGIRIAHISGMRISPSAALIVGLISLIGICLKVLELKYGGHASTNALEKTAADCSLMLLNDTGENPSAWKNSLNLLYDMVERPPKDETWIHFMNIIKNPQENLERFLKFIPPIIEVCKPFCSRVAGVEGDVLLAFLEFLSILLSQAVERNKIEGKGSDESEKGVSNLEKCFREIRPRPGAGNEIAKTLVGSTVLEEYELDLFGFKLCFLLNHRSADCKRFLENLLKTNYTLEECTPYPNIKLEGELIGFIVPFSFLSQNVAIIVLHLDKLAEVNNKKLN